MKLEIGEVAAQRSFCFLWCGSAEGLSEGRKCLRAWGFRRCEDICWIKTNKKDPGNVKYMEPKSLLQHTKEHCLMGIKGTVRRSTDFDFIHANVDLDIIITEEVFFNGVSVIFKHTTYCLCNLEELHVLENLISLHFDVSCNSLLQSHFAFCCKSHDSLKYLQMFMIAPNLFFLLVNKK